MPSSPAQTADDCAISVEERVWVSSKLFAAIEKYFAHWEAIPDVSLDATYREYIKRATSAATRFQFDRDTMRFMSTFRNGHTSFSDDRLNSALGQPLGFMAVRITDRWIVSESAVPELQPGDVIERIDAEPFERFVQQQLVYVSASSERGRETALFHHHHLFPEVFGLALEGGRVVEIDRHIQYQAEKSGRVSTMGHFLKASVAYLRIASFECPVDEALTFVRQLSDTVILIVDVRGNGGGTTPSVLVQALMDRPYPSWIKLTPVSIALFEVYAHLSELVSLSRFSERDQGFVGAFSEYFSRSELRSVGAVTQPAPPWFAGKLFILTDGRCASACEDFLMPFKVTGRAILVGETTKGTSGQPYFFDFGNGMSFRVGSKRMLFPDGTAFEGAGVQPDVIVRPSAIDLREGKDPILTKALELADSLG